MTNPRKRNSAALPALLLALLVTSGLTLSACGKKNAPVWRDVDGQPMNMPTYPGPYGEQNAQ